MSHSHANGRLIFSGTLFALVLIPSLAVAPLARADDDALRCGSRLVNPGIERESVLKLCGEPAARKTELVPQYVRNANGAVMQVGTVNVEYWTYDRGTGRFPALLKFEEDKLVSIEFVRP